MADPARHRGRGRARLDPPLAERPLLWLLGALLWACVTYRAAALELPSANVMTTAIAAAAAYTAGYYARKSHDPHRAASPAPAHADDHHVALDADDLGLLRFEQQHWRSGPAKAQAIVEQFGCTPTRYFQRLNQLIDIPDAAAAAPVLVARLRRIRDARRARIHPDRNAENHPRG